MKIASIFCVLFLFSGALLAADSTEKVITGEEAQAIYQQINGFEYSSAAITTGVEYHLTVRHNKSVSCQKEETKYANSESATIEYTCQYL